MAKAQQDYKKIMEVYEAVETAVTQLRNLRALDYLKQDFGLMNKIVMKLPLTNQTQYTQYLTSPSVKADLVTSRWDKFWTWMKMQHDQAVQASLMYMCDKTGPKSGTSTKPGMACHTCGGIGHMARACPSKSKSGVSSLKINMAVIKIKTKDEYKLHLPDTKKQIGDCPVCGRAPHMYSRTFPFGKADWPSNRLESCPQFLSKSPNERG